MMKVESISIYCMERKYLAVRVYQDSIRRMDGNSHGLLS